MFLRGLGLLSGALVFGWRYRSPLEDVGLSTWTVEPGIAGETRRFVVKGLGSWDIWANLY